MGYVRNRFGEIVGTTPGTDYTDYSSAATNTKEGLQQPTSNLDKVNTFLRDMESAAKEPGSAVPGVPGDSQDKLRELAQSKQQKMSMLQSLASSRGQGDTTYAPWAQALMQAQQLVQRNRAPSLWGQVPAGTMTEAARHNRAMEELTGAEIATRGSDGGTADERKRVATAEAYKRLGDLYRKAVEDPEMQDKPHVAAVETVRRYLQDPVPTQLALKYGVDNYSLLSNFVRTYTDFPSLEGLQDWVSAENLKHSGGDKNAARQDPLYRLLESVISAHYSYPLMGGY